MLLLYAEHLQRNPAVQLTYKFLVMIKFMKELLYMHTSHNTNLFLVGRYANRTTQFPDKILHDCTFQNQ